MAAGSGCYSPFDSDRLDFVPSVAWSPLNIGGGGSVALRATLQRIDLSDLGICILGLNSA